MHMHSSDQSIVLLNKSDLEEVVCEDEILKEIRNTCAALCEKVKIVKTSARMDSGMEEVMDLIREMFFYGKILYNDQVYITNMRHKEAILEALDSMNQVEKSLEMDMPEDFYSIDLMSAYVHHVKDQIRICRNLSRSLHTNLFHHILCIADTGSIDDI